MWASCNGNPMQRRKACFSSCTVGDTETERVRRGTSGMYMWTLNFSVPTKLNLQSHPDVKQSRHNLEGLVFLFLNRVFCMSAFDPFTLLVSSEDLPQTTVSLNLSSYLV